MTDTARDSNVTPQADVNGLEDLFLESVNEIQSTPDKPDRADGELVDPVSFTIDLVRSVSNPDNNQSDFWTPTDAAKYYGVSVRTIRRRLQDGTLAGYKHTGPNGPEWRINPVTQIEFSPDKLDKYPDAEPLGPDREDILSDRSDVEPVRLVTDPDKAPNSDPVVAALLTRVSDVEAQLAKAQTELQGAVWRNGYLEAQIEVKNKEIKLLTDSQHKPGWWSKFKSWFFGAP